MQAADAFPPTLPDAVPHQLTLLAERLSRTLAVARALALAGRRVDLSGMQDGVGLLCAKTLDLPRGEARHLLPALYELVAQIDSLHHVMHRPGP
jgi:hypothetical protein